MQFNFCVAPRCPRGSLVPYKNEENQFHPVQASLGTGAPMPTKQTTNYADIVPSRFSNRWLNWGEFGNLEFGNDYFFHDNNVDEYKLDKVGSVEHRPLYLHRNIYS